MCDAAAQPASIDSDACLAWLLCAAERVPSPCYVLDVPRLKRNMAILNSVQEATGARILLALKGFAAWSVFPEISRQAQGPLWGVCASSVDEARLGREEFGGEVHAFAAAWDPEEMRELTRLADHIVFNSLTQRQRHAPIIANANETFRRDNPIDCGLRLNPEYPQGKTPMYDPCVPGSRLGVRARELSQGPEALTDLSGLHFHALCEQDAESLERLLRAFEDRFAFALKARSWDWLNFGGGHHITRPGYNIPLLNRLLNRYRKKYGAQIYLEPGEAVALNAGWLVAEVLDIVQADIPVAILNMSAACHTPDVLEMPYQPDVFYSDGKKCQIRQASAQGDGVWRCRLAGKSCLAGDVIGEYGFAHALETGERLIFGDMAIYSMVKNNTFNGLRLPSIAVFRIDEASGKEEFRVIRSFGYEDFKGRLS